jgi:hypothetical protein
MYHPQSEPLNQSKWHFPEPFTHRVNPFRNLNHETPRPHTFQRQQNLNQQLSINRMPV